jgi:hypothetical protein
MGVKRRWLLILRGQAHQNVAKDFHLADLAYTLKLGAQGPYPPFGKPSRRFLLTLGISFTFGSTGNINPWKSSSYSPLKEHSGHPWVVKP